MVTMVVVVVVVVAPKWNEQRKNEPGVSGARGEHSPMGSTYPRVVVGRTGGRRWIHDL